MTNAKTDPSIAPGPVLLVTGLALVESAAEADVALAPFRTSRVLDRALFTLDAVPTTYLGDSDLSRRQVKFLSDKNFQRPKEIRAERDPEGLFVGYLAGPDGATNRNHWE